MESYGLLLAALLLVAAHLLGIRRQRQRIALLSGYLQPYRIEALMAELIEGYLRALGATEEGRRDQIWAMMSGSEARLAAQLQSLAGDLAGASAATMRVGRADLRKLIAVHANGVRRAIDNSDGLDRRDQAYTLCAEMYLLQHSCHWYCRSRAVASARLLARHKTSYAQVLAAVSDSTRDAYLALVGR
ncbi:MAG: hypothetical protein KDH17_01100 [Rhodocyclaceae bacterium]|nr:hypothetical protein [Rhodocyclaceae bacterium]